MDVSLRYAFQVRKAICNTSQGAANEPPPPTSRPGRNPRRQSSATGCVHPFRERHLATEKTKKPEPVFNRFGLYCPTPDWQHWQSASNEG